MAPQFPKMHMIEAFIDGQLDQSDTVKISQLIKTSPEAMRLYLILNNQKNAIKNAFMSDTQKH